jgi:hypothetical protein
MTHIPNTQKKGSDGGDSACLELSRDKGDMGKVKGREPYVSVLLV